VLAFIVADVDEDVVQRLNFGSTPLGRGGGVELIEHVEVACVCGGKEVRREGGREGGLEDGDINIKAIS
jgi:hypothetical protein